MQYDHKLVEKKWQKRWEEEGVFTVSDKIDAKKKKYILDMFPYPSGAGLHVGHPEGYTATDIYSRYLRMNGFSVLHPMGWDAFGLPAENYAIKSGIHPKESTEQNIKTFTRQIKSLGFSYDWSREVNTASPNYYRWTQWLFLQLYKAGLAYKKAAPVNWCPSCQTVLANEQVVDGKCERCASVVELKNLEQWFFRITGESFKLPVSSYKTEKRAPYPERLLNNLDTLDWPEPIKLMQKNWIGKSEGVEIEFGVVIARECTCDRGNPNGASDKDSNVSDAQRDGQIASLPPVARNDIAIKVFTTRPDTLFGATYMVLAPEHSLVQELKEQIANWPEVEDYRKKASIKSQLERTDLAKEKTGVELKGIKAVNPANKEKIPVWVADYVLAGYGTGAIMAVPGHDERDFEFARKFDLPIRQVIASENGIKRENEEFRSGGSAVIFDPQTQKYAVAHWKQKWAGTDTKWYGLFSGGVAADEDMRAGVLREVEEESGLYDFQYIEELGTYFAHYYNTARDTNRFASATGYLMILNTLKSKDRKLEGHENFDVKWVAPVEILDNWVNVNKDHGIDHWVDCLKQAVGRAIELGYDTTNDSKVFFRSAYTGNGIMINSGEFNRLDNEEAKWKITEKVGGKRTVQYKLRDWLISRQRYWGAPIPIIYCDDCARLRQGFGGQGEHPVPEEDLPVVLPDDVDFRPTGESPLARSKTFHEVKCPKCGKPARRESDTMDTFVDSSWYFLRYTDPTNEKEFAAKDKINAWLPVDTYVGGAEHAVLHLMYARFIYMVLYDLGFLGDFSAQGGLADEPFVQLRNQGLILGPDGQKMSKSRGNVINPDEVVEKFGADTMRLYEMFMGPLEDAKPWDMNGIIGVRRFLDRVWGSFELQVSSYKKEESESIISRELHKLIKKVGSDIESFGFNTAVSAFMIFVNAVYKAGEISQKHFETFLKVLHSFAPHLTNELWEKLGHTSLLEKESWPKYDEKVLAEKETLYIVQINGKVRGSVLVVADADESVVVSAAKRDEKIVAHLAARKIIKTIFVQGRLVNFVVK